MCAAHAKNFTRNMLSNTIHTCYTILCFRICRTRLHVRSARRACNYVVDRSQREVLRRQWFVELTPFIAYRVSFRGAHMNTLAHVRKSTHRSVVDLTSSRFHRPHVSCRAVEANSKKLMISSRPIGPKKYVKISMSPVEVRESYIQSEQSVLYTIR